MLARPDVGMVQTRWSHLNEAYTPFTRVQSLALDGHFVVEQTARSRSGLLINFNGSGGVWRRACIEDAGGWQADTMTEDMDLSYRAQLAGWHNLYLPDVDAPAELPAQMEAFKQQARWAQGSCRVKIETYLEIFLRLDRRIKGIGLDREERNAALGHPVAERRQERRLTRPGGPRTAVVLFSASSMIRRSCSSSGRSIHVPSGKL